MSSRGALAAVLLSAVVFAQGPAAARAPSAELVVIAGQSNALGYGLSAADLPLPLRRPTPGVQIWDGRRFVEMQAGRNTGSPRNPASWGPEAGFARAWRAAHGDRTLYVVKYARGSTPLAAGPGPDWAPESHELFRAAQTEIAHAEAALRGQGLAPRIAAVLWMQGETDATDERRARLYQANLRRLLAAIRTAWGQAGSPVVIGLIPPGGAFADRVRAAQSAVDAGDPRALSVDTAGLPLQTDGLHLSGEGQARLGAEMHRVLQSTGPMRGPG